MKFSRITGTMLSLLAGALLAASCTNYGEDIDDINRQPAGSLVHGIPGSGVNCKQRIKEPVSRKKYYNYICEISDNY